MVETPSPLSRATALVFLSGLLAGAGCQTAVYDADSLPPHLAVPPAIDVSSLDLSRLSRPSPPTATLRHGDVINVSVATGSDEPRPPVWSLRVAEDGTITVPLVGPVPVAGMELEDAERRVAEMSVRRGVYRRPCVSMQIETRRTNRVTVLGAVREPGQYELPASGGDLLAALVAAGGLADDADRVVEIRGPQRRRADSRVSLASYKNRRAPPAESVVRVDLVATTTHGGGELQLEDGAVVTVTQKPPRVIHVMGLVRKPAQFELAAHQDTRVLDALALAGGRTLSAADKVYVIRNLPGREQSSVIEVSVRQAKRDGNANILLTAGDVVSVEETPVTFVLGALRQFVNFGVGLRGPMTF